MLKKINNLNEQLARVEQQFSIKLPKKVDVVSPEEYEEKEDKAYIARIVLDRNERGKHLLLFIEEQLKTAEQAILNNTIRDSVQEGFINGIASRLSLTKKEQVEELSGKYQALRGLLTTLQFWIDDFNDLEKAIDEGKVVIKETHKEK